MKRTILILIFSLSFISNSKLLGQKLCLPNWIFGTWQNTYESNTNNFIFWTFANDSIFIDKGFPFKISDRECLNMKYSGYKISYESSDSRYKIHFSKVNEEIVYEFKLQKVYYSDKPVLTYSLTIDGIVKRNHNTSCNLVFTK